MTVTTGGRGAARDLRRPRSVLIKEFREQGGLLLFARIDESNRGATSAA